MNKNIIIALAFMSSFSAFSAEVDMDKIAKERLEWTKKHFAEQGSPFPDGGIRILPEKKMSEYNTFKKIRAKNREDVKKFGYIKKSSPDIQSLMSFKRIAKNQLSSGSTTQNPASDSLRHHINEIEMAYSFHGVPENEVLEMLGVAPSVTYVAGEGWAGAIQFFTKSGIGTCSFRENNVTFSHGSTVLPQEDVTRDINNKATIVTVSGEKKIGFEYSVDWFDETYFRELKCVNATYSPDTTSAVIKLAQAIDNN